MSQPLYTRIACLCTEAVETLYSLGAEDCIAGISGFTVYPPRAREEKPKISGFSSSKIERILAVQPDLVIGFSDLQAEICRDLVREGIEVHVFNHRNVAGILRMVRTLASFVDKTAEGAVLMAELEALIAQAQQQAQAWFTEYGVRPKVYFEEWNEPLMSGIQWVAELVTIAGGEDCFPELSSQHSAKQRIIADPSTVIGRAPDLIIGSWCGKKFRPEQLIARAGWEAIPAVQNAAHGMVAEIKSPDILAPGAVAIRYGLPKLQALIGQWYALQTPLNTKL